MHPTLLGIIVIILSIGYILANHLNASSNFADLVCLSVIILAVGIIRRKEWARKGLVAASIAGIVWTGWEIFDWFYRIYLTDQIKLREDVNRFGFFLEMNWIWFIVLFFFSYIVVALSWAQTKKNFS